jgi:putative signal transducing protein
MTHQEEPGPVTVFRTSDPAVLAVAQSLLEEAEIDFFVAGGSLMNLFPGSVVGSDVTPEIQVPPEKADEARELLKDLL